jgi:hypothetical protein
MELKHATAMRPGQGCSGLFRSEVESGPETQCLHQKTGVYSVLKWFICSKFGLTAASDLSAIF